jgi:hypothetical protein
LKHLYLPAFHVKIKGDIIFEYNLNMCLFIRIQKCNEIGYIEQATFTCTQAMLVAFKKQSVGLQRFYYKRDFKLPLATWREQERRVRTVTLNVPNPK